MLPIESYSVNVSLNGQFFCEVVRISEYNLKDVLKNLREQFTPEKGFELMLEGIPYKSCYRLDINDYLDE